MKKHFNSLKKPVLKANNLMIKFAFILFTLFSFNVSKAQTGEALSFDGINDKVDLPFAISGNYTKEVWIYADPAALTGFPNILSGTATSLQIANGVLTAGHAGSFNQAVDQTGPLVANTWYHVAVTYDNVTGNINLYKNGVLVSVPGATAPTYTETILKIGTFTENFYFTGKIDEVRIWSVVRTSAQIAASMSCGLTGHEPFLTAYYKFNQGIAGGSNPTITFLADSAAKCVPYNGTLVGFALTGTSSNWVAPGAPIASTCSATFPDINITGNATCISSGDITPSFTDSTDFGDFGVTPITRTFIIQNTGNAILNLSSATITGSTNFTIVSPPASSVAPGGSTSITITFNPIGALIASNATVTINNSDTDEAVFTFAITGFNRGLGQALSFDGINDSVTLPVSLSGSYTKEVWINTAQLSGFPNLITGTGTALFLNNGQLAAGHAPGFNQVLDPTPILANTWYHVAVSYDSVTTVLSLYKNGTLVSSNNAPVYTEPNLRLGTFMQANFYSGLMDEVRLWTNARSQAQIAGSRNCNLTGDEFFLKAYYKFNQGSAGGSNPTETMLRDTADKCFPLDGTLFNFALNGPVSNWVAPGAPVTGTCAGTFQNISISASGCIVSGDMTPSTADGTNFGLNTINTATDKIFTITNTGSATLILTQPIIISGVDAGLFTVITAPATSLAPGASTTFTVRFISPTAGTFNAIITANNNDLDEAIFVFAVQASASLTTPVTLISFDGKLKGSIVQLNWKTTAELNNRGFEVLRSDNAQGTFEKIGYVKGTNSSTGSTYNFVDYAPLKGINTYRLRQVDLDGRGIFSNIVVVNNTDNSILISAYPNPFQQSFRIIFNDAKLLNTIAKVRSVSGSTVETITLNSYQKDVNLGKVSPGIYYISFANGEILKVIKN